MQNLTLQFKIQKYFLPIFLIFVFCILNLAPQSALASGTTNITIEIISLCGNGVIDQGEQCDGSNLAGQTCSSRGYTGGTLSCNSTCTINTSQCTSASPPSGGGGGGGGGGGYTPPTVVTQVTFSGKAYPLSKVSVLKDGQPAITTIADPGANFSVALTGLSSGNYNFSVFGEDSNGRRSTLFTFPVFITSGASTNVGNIFLAPTIDIDKSEVKHGDNIAIFGQSAPNSEVTISVNSDEEFFNKTKADKNGAYLYNFDTTPLNIGQHLTKSKSALDGTISSFGNTISFAVGTKNTLAQLPTTAPAKGDMNNDKRVNLVDFSVAAYWYKRPSPPASVDLNGDGKVDLIDFSIMAFYWTG